MFDLISRRTARTMEGVGGWRNLSGGGDVSTAFCVHAYAARVSQGVQLGTQKDFIIAATQLVSASSECDI
jgi:hypothetical protein